MLEKIREGSQGTWAIVILGLVILSFVFAGVGGYVSSTSSAAATVNGEEIPQSTFERAFENERARLQSQYGDAFTALTADPAYLSQFRQSVMDRLIADKLIEQAADNLGLRVSNEQIRQQIVTMPEFQIGGQFNNDRFQATLRQAGFQTNTFRDYMRNEMTRQQVAQVLLGSEFTLNSEATRILNLQMQTRDIQYVTIPAAKFSDGVEVSEDDIQVYYQQNLAQFDTDEKVSLEYIELDAKDLMANIEVTDAQLMELYESASNDYISEEQRRVSHILIEFGDDEDAARERAQQALDRVESGEDFATVAKDVSDDTFSAENGGDLDFFGRDVMDPAFEDAAFGLDNVGDVSDVVETEFGLHIIKLTDLNPEQVTPFEDVKDQLAQRLKEERAIEEVYMLQTQAAEIAFEMPDSLAEVARATGTEVQKTDLFTRETPPEAVSSPVVVAKAFSDELIIDRVNSDVITVDDNHFMLIRVQNHEPERTKSLDEVKQQIVNLLTAEKAQLAAKNWATELMTSLQNSQEISDQLSAKELAWELQSDVNRFGGDVPRAIVDQAFELAPVEGQNLAVVELASGGAGLVKLNNVKVPEESPAEQVAAIQQRLDQARAQGIYSSLVKALRSDSDVTIMAL